MEQWKELSSTIDHPVRFVHLLVIRSLIPVLYVVVSKNVPYPLPTFFPPTNFVTKYTAFLPGTIVPHSNQDFFVAILFPLVIRFTTKSSILYLTFPAYYVCSNPNRNVTKCSVEKRLINLITFHQSSNDLLMHITDIY